VTSRLLDVIAGMERRLNELETQGAGSNKGNGYSIMPGHTPTPAVDTHAHPARSERSLQHKQLLSRHSSSEHGEDEGEGEEQLTLTERVLGELHLVGAAAVVVSGLYAGLQVLLALKELQW
jgi:hypothetical protein